MGRRVGRSRAEVLIALLVLALLAGLALSAVGRMRAAADREGCRNNLRHLGLAVYSYSSSFGDRLPPATDRGPLPLTGRGLSSVLANLTPYIEATSYGFYRDMPAAEYHAHSSVAFTYTNKDRTTSTEAGGPANRCRRVFLDPADDTARQLRDVPMTLPDGSTGHYATGSYAANGLVPWGARDFAAAFPTGAGHTILIAERPQVCRPAGGDEVHNLWALGSYSPNMPGFATLTPVAPPGLPSTGQAAPAAPLPDESDPDRDRLIRVRIGRRDVDPGSADFPTPVRRVRAGRPCDPRLPGGPHPAGMQVLMADASVRVFGPDTRPWVFWSACLPGGPAYGP